MTRHARTVILLGGWLLMFPPSTVLPGAGPPTTLKGSPELKGLGPSIPDLRAPLSQWTQAAAFDTAKECEGAREEPLRREHLPHEQQQLTPGFVPVLPQARRVPPAGCSGTARDAFPPRPSTRRRNNRSKADETGHVSACAP